MPDQIGPHLLGRIPSPSDARDYHLENFLHAAPAAGVIDGAAVAAELRQTTVSFKQWAATKYPDVTLTHWWRAFNLLGQENPPPAGNVVWADLEPVLDQGNFGTCVGNGFAQFGNTNPVDDRFTETDARAIYYEATVLDGAPDDPDAPGGGQQGATVRSGVKAMVNRGRISVYAFASTVDAVRTFLDTKGPVVFGIDWTNDMFNPDANGFITPTGGVAGGHCILALGDLKDVGALRFRNSWGPSWGLGGECVMRYADVQTLLDQQGEAVAAVELPL